MKVWYTICSPYKDQLLTLNDVTMIHASRDTMSEMIDRTAMMSTSWTEGFQSGVMTVDSCAASTSSLVVAITMSLLFDFENIVNTGSSSFNASRKRDAAYRSAYLDDMTSRSFVLYH